MCALVRGSLAAALGRADEAAAAFAWVAAEAAPEGPAGARELHAFAYAHYELGVLFADGAKARLAGGRSGHRPPPPSRLSQRKLEGLLASDLLAGLPPAACAARARAHLRAARDVRADFNWRVRLHLRVHLSLDDLRRAEAGGGDGSSWEAPPPPQSAAPREEEEEDAGEVAEGFEELAEAAAGLTVEEGPGPAA